MAELLDLDALVPQDAQVKFGDKLYAVHPPTTEAVFRLTKLGGDLEQAGILDRPKVALDIFEKLRNEVAQCLPDLDLHQITAGQLIGLSEFVIGLGIPTTNSRFSRDITADNAKKKRKSPPG